MTSPNTNRPPEGRRFWKIAAITLGAGTLIVGTVAIVGTWVFVNNGLTPLLERRLSKLLERELELGELEALSWNGIRVGQSKLNATDNDPTYATASAVEVEFSPLQVVFQRQLDIDLRLIGAEGYVEQHPEDGWLGIDIPTFEPPPEEPPVKVRMDDIEVVDSQITLVPLPAEGDAPSPLLLSDLNGSVGIDPIEVNGQGSQRVEFEATATPPQGGVLELTGEVLPTTTDDPQQPIKQEIRLGIKGEGVAAAPVMAFLLPTMGQQNLPMAATAGRVSGQWTVSFLPEQPITVDGAGTVNNGQLRLDPLPSGGPWGNTIDGINATARFKGTTITIDRAEGSYGDLAATATGTVDWTEDYDLVAQVPDIDLEQLLERAEVEVPIALSGVFDSTVAITGPMLQPQLSADVVAIGPVTIDRVVLDELDADVVMQSDRIENLLDVVTVTQLTATPEIGGQITGSGVLNLANIPEGPPELDFTARASDVAGDAILTLYDVQPLPFTLGAVAANATIVGAPANLETRINVQAPTLAYGGQIYPANATAIFADGGLSIPQARVEVGTGTLVGSGQVGTDSWQADLTANGVNLQSLGLAQLPPGSLNADVAVAGPLQGASLNTLLALGNYTVQLADGSVQGDVELQEGRWQTNATLMALGLGQFASQLGGSTSGTVNVQGQLDALTLADLEAQGDLSFSAGLAGLSPQLAGFDAPLEAQFAWSSQELRILQASSAQLQARGVISPDLVGNQFQGLRGFVLDLDAERYPLALLPSPVPLDGFASFSGRLLGTPMAPQLTGDLELAQLSINQVPFDPLPAQPQDHS